MLHASTRYMIRMLSAPLWIYNDQLLQLRFMTRGCELFIQCCLNLSFSQSVGQIMCASSESIGTHLKDLICVSCFTYIEYDSFLAGTVSFGYNVKETLGIGQYVYQYRESQYELELFANGECIIRMIGEFNDLSQ